MSNDTVLIFPELISLAQYGGDFQQYFEAVYTIFKKDFIVSQPNYENKKVMVRKYPEIDGMHRTFYHITHEGEDENNRNPDLRRMERIKYPKFVIDHCKNQNILMWKNKRGRDDRILLLNKEEQYIVILTQRKTYYLFTTAYYIEREHRMKKLLKEYELYKNTKTA